MSRVAAPRRRGRRPPKMSCWVWTKNSISRMPPRPSLTSCPGTVTTAWPRKAVDLSLHRVDIGDGRVVEILAPDERREFAEEARSEREIPATGRALMKAARSQFWPNGLVIDERGRHRDRDRGGAGVGTQPEIHAQHVSVGGALPEKLDQSLRDPHVERRRYDTRGQGRRGGVVDDHEVDVARVVEFAAASLAEHQHRDPAIAP